MSIVERKQPSASSSTIETSVTAPALVLGGTGKTGRRVVERLTTRGLPVRIGSRSGLPPFDWEVPETWAPALHGVGSVYLTYYPDIAVPGSADAIRSFLDLALDRDVRRIVLLSGRGEEGALDGEKVLQESGADWTIVRSSWFMQNFSESFFLDGILSGELVLPAGDIPEPFVDSDDIADVVAKALTEEGHIGQLYEVTGPRMLTFAEAVEEIAKATGRSIRFVSVSSEEYVATLAEYGVPADYIWLVNYVITTVLDGRNAYLTDGVQRALGREPRDFADYARHVAATGVWDVATVGEQEVA